MVMFGVVPPLDEIGNVPVTFVTVPFPLPVPAPIAVLKSAALNALTVLSTLNLGKVIAEGLVKVNIDCPIVVPPKSLRIPSAALWLTVLSALYRKKDIAPKSGNKNVFAPRTVAPKLVLAAEADVAPVPPFNIGKVPVVV